MAGIGKQACNKGCRLGYVAVMNSYACAGQGLVAFARGAHDELEYAIKFFVARKPFEAALDLYQSRAVGSLLPRVNVFFIYIP